LTRKRANADIWPEAVQADQSQIANRWPEAVQSGGGEPGCAAETLAAEMATTATFVIKTESREYFDLFFFTTRQKTNQFEIFFFMKTR